MTLLSQQRSLSSFKSCVQGFFVLSAKMVVVDRLSLLWNSCQATIVSINGHPLRHQIRKVGGIHTGPVVGCVGKFL